MGILDFRHTITVQHTALDRGKNRNPSRPNSPPGSPSIPRLRAIACKLYTFNSLNHQQIKTVITFTGIDNYLSTCR